MTNVILVLIHERLATYGYYSCSVYDQNRQQAKEALAGMRNQYADKGQLLKLEADGQLVWFCFYDLAKYSYAYVPGEQVQDKDYIQLIWDKDGGCHCLVPIKR